MHNFNLSPPPISFKPTDTFTISSRGKVYSGNCPQEFIGLMSEDVKGRLIDVGGVVETVIGIERFVMMHDRPLRLNEQIGLLVAL